MRLGGQAKGTPHLDGRSILSSLSSGTESSINFTSQLGMGRSYTSCSKTIKQMMNRNEGRYMDWVGKVDNNEVIHLTSDNYNPSRLVRVGMKGYHRISSINSISFNLTIPDPLNPGGGYLIPKKNDRILEILGGMDEKNNFISSIFDDRGVIWDVNPLLPHLREAEIPPLIEGRSSSKDDILNLLMGGLVRDSLGSNLRPEHDCRS